MATYVITGANRGIGYSIAKQLAAEGNKVIGTARNPSQATELAAIPGVKVVALDVTDPESQKAAAAEVSKLTGGAIDVLIANAGYYSDTLSLDFEAYPTETALVEDMKTSFSVNVVGTVLNVLSFLPLLKAGKQKKVIYISTPAGNTEFTKAASNSLAVAYSVSKAAGHFAMLKFAIKYASEGFIFVNQSPGMVDTSATGSAIPKTEEEFARFKPMLDSFFRASPTWDGKPLSPEDSAAKVIAIIKQLKPEDNMKFLTHNGDATTWF